MSQYRHSRIFVIGHPGAGKALFAKTLGNKLDWKFIDSDLGLEFRVGRTLTEIIGPEGEKSFYHCQSEILAYQIHMENIVVTTDASIVCDSKMRELLANEFVVYLQVSTPVQIDRISRHQVTLLPVNEMSEFLDQLHSERDSLYEKVAMFTINSDDSALEDHVLRIIKIISDERMTEKKLKLNDKELIFFHKKMHTPIRLSDQQAICLKLLAQGKSSKEIAKELNISYRTVESHIANTMEILGCSSSKELIALYHENS